MPSQSVLVLLVGLPGDVEHEKAYREQLQMWLDTVASSPTAPEKVYVFTDSPDAVTVPARLPSVISKSGREEFLVLGKTLAGQSNAVTVVVWGHGGMQGKTPVFHVRGPRLTSADFKTFAAQIPEARSQWILYFRGSGKFASELAGESRQIISSEKDTAFTSDPIGMPLLLKIVRQNPSTSFRAMGEELGLMTAAWYNERHLARTEEPTLWLGDAPPQKLVPAETSAALASAPPLRSHHDKSSMTFLK